MHETRVSYSAEGCVSTAEQRTTNPAESPKDGTDPAESPRDRTVSVESPKDRSVSAESPKERTAPAENASGDATDSLQSELDNSLKQKDVKLVPGQKVDLKVLILRQDSAVEGEEDVVGTGKCESEAGENKHEAVGGKAVREEKRADPQEKVIDGQLKVPQRKISRFLVSFCYCSYRFGNYLCVFVNNFIQY